MGSVTSGVQSTGWGLQAKPQKRENCAENLIECKNSILFREENFSVAISEGGHVPLISPFAMPQNMMATVSPSAYSS